MVSLVLFTDFDPQEPGVPISNGWTFNEPIVLFSLLVTIHGLGSVKSEILFYELLIHLNTKPEPATVVLDVVILVDCFDTGCTLYFCSIFLVADDVDILLVYVVVVGQ
jgi:hypothetical protein